MSSSALRNRSLHPEATCSTTPRKLLSPSSSAIGPHTRTTKVSIPGVSPCLLSVVLRFQVEGKAAGSTSSSPMRDTYIP